MKWKLCAALLALLIGLSAFPAAAQAQVSYSEIAHYGRGTTSAVGWRSDGQILAVGGSAGVWFLNGQLKPVGHDEIGDVSDLQWQPGGRQIAFVLDEGEVQIWTFAVNHLGVQRFAEAQPQGKLPSFADVYWSPDGKRIAITTRKQTDILDSASFHVLLELPDPLTALAWSPNGQLLAGSLSDNPSVIGLWDSRSGQRLETLKGGQEGLYFGSLLFSADGQTLAAASGIPGGVFLWDVQTGKLSNRPALDDITVDYQLVLAGHDAFVSLYQEQELGPSGAQLWDMRSGREITDIGSHDQLWRAAAMPGQAVITLISFSGKLRQWNLATNTVKEYALFMPDAPSVVAWSPDSERLAVSASDSEAFDSTPVFVWDVRRKTDQPLSIFTPYLVSDVRWLPDSRNLVTIGEIGATSEDYFAHRWDTDTGQFSGIILESTLQDGPMPIVDWTRDFKHVAYGWDDSSTFDIADSYSLPDRFELTTDADTIRQIGWNRAGTEVATLSAAKVDSYEKIGRVSLQVWDAQSGKQLAQFAATNWQSSFSWSPDGKTLSLIQPNANHTTTLDLLDAQTGKLRFTKTYTESIRLNWDNTGARFAIVESGGGLSILQIQASDTGDILAQRKFSGLIGIDWYPENEILTVAENNQIDFLDSDSGSDLPSIEARGVGSILWSPDGKKLALLEMDNTIRIWAFTACC